MHCTNAARIAYMQCSFALRMCNAFMHCIHAVHICIAQCMCAWAAVCAKTYGRGNLLCCRGRALRFVFSGCPLRIWLSGRPLPTLPFLQRLPAAILVKRSTAPPAAFFAAVHRFQGTMVRVNIYDHVCTHQLLSLVFGAPAHSFSHFGGASDGRE